MTIERRTGSRTLSGGRPAPAGTGSAPGMYWRHGWRRGSNSTRKGRDTCHAVISEMAKWAASGCKRLNFQNIPALCLAGALLGLTGPGASAASADYGRAVMFIDAVPKSRSDDQHLGLGQVICAMATKRVQGLRGCAVDRPSAKGGWVSALADRRAPFAVVRSDQQYRAWVRQGQQRHSPSRGDLRSLFTVDKQAIIALVPAVSMVFNPGASAHLRGSPEDLDTLAEIVTHYAGDDGSPRLERPQGAGYPFDCSGTDRGGSVWLIDAPPYERTRSLARRCGLRLLRLESAKAEGLVRSLPYLSVTDVSLADPNSDYGDQVAFTTVATATTVVTWRSVSRLVVETLFRAAFENFLELRALYTPALDIQPASNPNAIINENRSAPLHLGAWAVYSERGWVKPPSWVILGGFPRLSQAKRLAELLYKEYPDDFKNGLQVRLANQDTFAIIAGHATSTRQGNAEIESLRRLKLFNPYLYAALSSWSADLLPLPPRIYPHFPDERRLSEFVRGPQPKIAGLGWTVKASQVVRRMPKQSQLRYFKKTERPLAERLLQDLRSVGLDADLARIAGYETRRKLPPLHFELWLTGN